MNRVLLWTLVQVAVAVVSGVVVGPLLWVWLSTRDDWGFTTWLTGGAALLTWGAVCGLIGHIARRMIYGRRRR